MGAIGIKQEVIWDINGTPIRLEDVKNLVEAAELAGVSSQAVLMTKQIESSTAVERAWFTK